MAKTFEQLEKECNSTIKFVLIEMETLAALPPAIASDPYTFQERRQRVVRRLWALFKECTNANGCGAVQ